MDEELKQRRIYDATELALIRAGKCAEAKARHASRNGQVRKESGRR